MDNWIEIPGFEGEYKVSDMGQIMSMRSGKSLSPQLARGYPMVHLASKGAKYPISVHRIVLISFKGVNLKRKFVNHINGIKTDNRLVNLEWVTGSENICHSIDMNLSRIKHKRLTEKEIAEIRIKAKEMYQSALAKIYKVSQMTISRVVRMERYVDPPVFTISESYSKISGPKR